MVLYARCFLVSHLLSCSPTFCILHSGILRIHVLSLGCFLGAKNTHILDNPLLEYTFLSIPSTGLRSESRLPATRRPHLWYKPPSDPPAQVPAKHRRLYPALR
jgi:hypothetical protein